MSSLLFSFYRWVTTGEVRVSGGGGEREWGEYQPEFVATLTPFSPIEGQKWFNQISSQWESLKNRFALVSFGKNPVFTSLHLKSPVHVVPPPGTGAVPPPPLKGVLKLLVVLVQYFQYSKCKALTFGYFGAWVLFKSVSVTQCGRIILVLKPYSHMASPWPRLGKVSFKFNVFKA